VGGGTSPTGDKKATTAAEAAYTPFFGEWDCSGRWYLPVAVAAIAVMRNFWLLTTACHTVPRFVCLARCKSFALSAAVDACRHERALHSCQGSVCAVRPVSAVLCARLCPLVLQCYRTGRSNAHLRAHWAPLPAPSGLLAAQFMAPRTAPATSCCSIWARVVVSTTWRMCISGTSSLGMSRWAGGLDNGCPSCGSCWAACRSAVGAAQYSPSYAAAHAPAGTLSYLHHQ
jgi:hypothetical protein